MPGNIRPNNNNMWQVDPNEGLNDPTIISPETGGGAGSGPFAGASHAQLTMNVLHPSAQANIVDWEAPYDPANGHFEESLDMYTPGLWNLTDPSGIFINNLSSGAGISWTAPGTWMAIGNFRFSSITGSPASFALGAWYFDENPITLQIFSVDATPVASNSGLVGMGKITSTIVAAPNNFEIYIGVVNSNPSDINLAEKIYVQACIVDIYFWAD